MHSKILLLYLGVLKFAKKVADQFPHAKLLFRDRVCVCLLPHRLVQWVLGLENTESDVHGECPR